MNPLITIRVATSQDKILLAQLGSETFEKAFAALLYIVLIDNIKSNFKDSNNKIIWLIVVIFIPFIGVILYPLIGPGQKLKASEKDF